MRISRVLLARLVAEAEVSLQREICGLLVGGSPEGSVATVGDIVAAANVSPDPSDSFEIDPATLFVALRAERAGESRIIGCYHSHPNGTATPSARDAAAAGHPGWIWLIVAGADIMAWREVPGGTVEGQFEPVELILYDGEAGCTP